MISRGNLGERVIVYLQLKVKCPVNISFLHLNSVLMIHLRFIFSLWFLWTSEVVVIIKDSLLSLKFHTAFCFSWTMSVEYHFIFIWFFFGLFFLPSILGFPAPFQKLLNGAWNLIIFVNSNGKLFYCICPEENQWG